MRRIFFLFFIPWTYTVSFAQFPGMGGSTGSSTKIYDGKISGTVLESQTKKPVEFANIALYNTGSEKPMDGTVTDEKGTFKLRNLKNGTYRLTVTFIGFEAVVFDSLEISDKKTSVELETIHIEPSKKTLSEITVEGEQPLIETKIDKLVYNAAKDLTSKGGNATDVLRKVPMVTVDLDGNVMLQGTTNLKILINNKPSSIMAGTVADAMKMIPADEIEKVEVITSPSAKYDAEGTGGIINIITKKKNIEGLSGMVNAGAGTRSSNLFGSLNYRSGRFGTGLNVGGFGYTGKGDLSATRITNDTLFLEQYGPNKNTGMGPFAQWTTDLDLNSKNNLSTSFKLFGFFNTVDGNTTNTINGFKIFDAESNIRTNAINYDASIDYKRTFKKPEQEFTISALQTRNNRTTIYEVLRNNEGIYSQSEISDNTNINEETTLQTDYTHPFSKKVTLEAGGKAIFRDVNSDSETDFSGNGPGPYSPGTINSTFNYTQNVFAGYTVGSLTLKKFGLKLGLRYEQTEIEGNQKTDVSEFSSFYHNWIPSITVSFRKAGKYQVKLSYTQRIQRPSMTYLNPYRNTSDQFNITYGNPNLDAENSHAFEFGYSIFRNFGSINSTIYHRFTNNAIEKYSFVNGSIYETTYGNIGENSSTGGSIGTNVLYKKLMLSLNTNLYYYEVKSNQPELPATNHGVNYSVSLFGSLKFTDRWGVQAFGNFSGPKYTVQGFSTSFFYYNLSARREFKNGKGGIGIGLDNFATPYLHFRSEYAGSNFVYKTDNKIFFLGARISFDYRFGKMEFGQSKKKGIKNDDLKPGEDNGMGGGIGGGK